MVIDKTIAIIGAVALVAIAGVYYYTTPESTDTGGASGNQPSPLIGTWESEVVNGYYIHQKVLNADGTYRGTWYVQATREEYSQVTGTWSATCCTLTTVTDHTDTYDISLSGETLHILVDGSYREYTKV